MDMRKIFTLLVLLLAVAVIPATVDVADAGPGGGTYYANTQSGFRTAATGSYYTGSPLRKFVDSLPGLGASHANNLGNFIPIATAMPATAGVPNDGDYYEIGLFDYTQKMHTDLPKATKLRGYKDLNPAAPANPNGSYYLGPVIIATKGRPVRIKFVNNLAISTNPASNLFIPVDPTAMGAGMGPKTAGGADCDPMVTTCASYTENRATLHLHGGNTPWISDGTPHQWITPAGDPTPFKKGVSQQNVPDMPDPLGLVQGAATFYYTNQQSSRLMFYHDHAYGMTRLNVYAGEAAGYVLVDPQEEILINAGVLPNQDAIAEYRYGIPLIIQDKTFVPADIAIQDAKWDTTKWGQPGDLWISHVYEPNQDPSQGAGGVNPFGRWDYGPWFWPPVPSPNLLPGTTNETGPIAYNTSMTPESFMDTPVINGAAYPYLQVQPHAYRFRVLNASNDRAWNLQLYYVDPANPTEVKMVPANLATATTSPVLCSTATAMNESGLAIGAIDPATGRPLNSTGLPAGCWPTTWPTDARVGGVPDPTTAGPAIIQIGTEGGFLPAPVVIPSTPVGFDYNRRSIVVLNVLNKGLFLQPAERADIIIDFSSVPVGSKIILYNDAPAPVPGFDPRYDYYTGNPDQTDSGGAASTAAGFGPNTRTIMQFQVVAGTVAPFNLTALQNTATGLPNAYKTYQPTPHVPETPYGATYGTTYADTVGKIQDYSLTFSPASVSVGQALRSVKIVSGGTGYGVAPGVVLTGGGCSTPPAATATVSGGVVNNITLTNPGVGCTSAPVVSFTGIGTGATAIANFEPITLHMKAKAIQELWDPYGRMNATLGIELPFTNGNIQTTIPLGYTDPITENVPASQIQLWKITHNGVDTHPVHFHLYNVQLINRVGWDGQVRHPDDNEIGWKETVRMSPLEDVIVALQPKTQTLPFALPKSLRSLDVTRPASSILTVTNPLDGNATSQINSVQDYGMEYVWHCHILGHEENDFMRIFSMQVPTAVPVAPINFLGTPSGNTIQVSWQSGVPTGPNPDPENTFRVMRNGVAMTTIYPGEAQGIGNIVVTNGGATYSATPTVTISAPFTGFTTATATATVVAGIITAINVTNHGSGYLTLPTVTITDTTGAGAVAVANFGYAFTDSWVNSGVLYNYSIVATNALGDSAPLAGSATANVWAAASSVTLTVSPAPIAVPAPPHYLAGTSIVFTASGVGSTVPYQYRFWLNNGTTNTIVQDYSTLATWTLPPSTLAGNYTVTVDVRTTLTSPTPDASNTAAVLILAPVIPAPPRIGVFRPSTGEWYLDLNSSHGWDGCGVDGCFGPFGTAGDIAVVGDWTNTGTTKFGVFRPSTGMWYLDLNGSGTWSGCGPDGCIGPFGTAGDIPVVGDWGNTGTVKIGVFRPSTGMWYLDLNGSGTWSGCGPDSCIGPFGTNGDLPVVGDWGNTGTVKIGVFRPSSGMWYMDLNGSGTWNGCGTDACYGPFGTSGDLPVTGKW